MKKMNIDDKNKETKNSEFKNMALMITGEEKKRRELN